MNMKTKMLILFSIIGLLAYSQQTSKLYNTVVFPANMPHSVLFPILHKKIFHSNYMVNLHLSNSLHQKSIKIRLSFRVFPILN